MCMGLNSVISAGGRWEEERILIYGKLFIIGGTSGSAHISVGDCKLEPPLQIPSYVMERVVQHAALFFPLKQYCWGQSGAIGICCVMDPALHHVWLFCSYDITDKFK